MTEKFNTLLNPYKDSNNKQIKGKYHFQLLEELEKGCYPMSLEYESTDPTKAEAYQYNGYIVVGNRCYLTTSPIIIPFNTTAATEEEISVTEKLNTQFNAVVNAFSDSELEDNLGNLPYFIHIVKGEFKDYWADSANAKKNIDTDFNEGYELPLNFPLSTGNNGVGTNTVKVKDIYTSTETISDLNTIIFKCKGTRDRGDNNYVPAIIEAPLIIGTTDVKLINKPQHTDTLNIDGTVKTVAVACGRGVLELHCNVMYKFATHTGTDNYGMKYGYDDYLSDSSKYVRCGGLQLQYKENDTWIPVPKAQLTAADSNTTIDSDGIIYQKVGHETGGIKVKWTNPFPYMTSNNKDIQYRWKYIGKVGETRGLWTGGYDLRLDKSYGDPVAYDSRIVMNESSFIGTPNSNINICGKLQMKQGNNWVDTDMGQGTVTVVVNNTTKTANVSSNGTFCVTVTEEGGEFPISISYHDPNGVFEDATETSTLIIESTGTRIQIDDEFIGAIDGNVSLTGKVVSYYNGTTHDITNGTGTITGTFAWNGVEYEREVNINSNGTFTLQSPKLHGGTYEVTLFFTDPTLKFAECYKNTKIIVPYDVSIELDSNSISVLNGDSFSVNGVLVLNNGIDDLPYYRIGSAETISNSLNSSKFTIASDGTFTATGVAPNGDSNVTLTYAGNKEIKSTTTTLAIHAIKSDVSLKFSKPLIRAYDTGANDSSTYKITLKDDYNNPVKSGTVEIRLQSKYWEFFPNSDEFNKYTLIKSYTVPSTGELNVNAYELINSTFLNKFSKYPYFRYYLIARYVPTETNKYNAVDELDTIRNNETVHDVELEYRVYNPKVEMKIWVKSPSASSFPSTPTHNISLTNLNFSENQGNLSSLVNSGNEITVPQNANIKIEFGLFDSNNNRLGEIRYAKWVTTDKQIPIYVQSDNEPWDYTLNDQGQKQTYLPNVVRKVVTYTVETLNGEPVLDSNGNPNMIKDEIPTSVPRHPCYAGVPLPFESMFFKEEPDGTYEVTTDTYNRFNFTLPEEANGTSTLFLGFTQYMGYILPGRGESGVVNSLPNLILALQGGLDSQTNYYSSQTLNKYTRQYSIYFNIKFKVQ